MIFYQYKVYYHFIKIMECIRIVKLAFKFKLYDHKCNLWARFQLEQIPPPTFPHFYFPLLFSYGFQYFMINYVNLKFDFTI
jgi:hypothetical protein